MTNAQAEKFAAGWIESFNRKDVDAVLAHFAEDAQFTSPRAVAITGKATLHSRQALGDYWRTAIGSLKSIHFTLDHVINDDSAGRLAIVYISEVDGRKIRAAEFFQFNSAMEVIRGEAMHGAAIE